MPCAQFDGDRIMLYQLRADAQGEWWVVAPRINAETGLRAWDPHTYSLVLVFDEDGVLERHSLIESQ
jgi:hypothetical protein